MTSQSVLPTTQEPKPLPIGVDPIMRLPAVLATVGMSRGWVLANIKEGNFPAPVKLGAKAIGWRSSAISHWLTSRKEPICSGDKGLA